jgi:hypothetical protein
MLRARVDGDRRCRLCLEATASLRRAALSIALSLIVRWGSPVCAQTARTKSVRMVKR